MNQNHSESFPDPHPTPWTAQETQHGHTTRIVDANGEVVAEAAEPHAGYPPHLVGQIKEIVERVNRMGAR